MEKADILEILKNWEIDPVISIKTLGRVSTITTISRSKYFLKEKYSKERVKQEYDLAIALSQRKLPVPVPLRTKQGLVFLAYSPALLFCLYPCLEGDVITDYYADNAEEHAGWLGQALARLHQSLAEIDSSSFPRKNIELDVFEWALPIITEQADRETVSKIKVILEKIKPDLADLEKLPVQLIHRDPHRGNFLFKNGSLSGFLDFDITVRNIRIFDLAYCSTSMLAEGFTDPAKKEFWYKLLEALIISYHELNPLTENEFNAFWQVMLAIEVIFIAYYLQNYRRQEADLNSSVFFWIYQSKSKIERVIQKFQLKEAPL